MNEVIYLTKHELWFLLSQAASSTIIGFRNPMIGTLAEDMFPLIQEASFSLLDKGLIYADSNNQIKTGNDLDLLIHTLTTPQHTLLTAIRFNNIKKEEVLSFNFQGKNTVLLRELDDGSYSLQEIETKDDLLSLIAEPFIDKVFWAPDTEPLYLPQEDITAIQQLADASNFSEVKDKIETAKGDEQSKIHLLVTLQHPLVRYSCIGFLDRNNLQKNTVDGFSILAGEHYLWILEVVDEAEKLVRISKITMKQLNSKFGSLIPFSSGA